MLPDSLREGHEHRTLQATQHQSASSKSARGSWTNLPPKAFLRRRMFPFQGKVLDPLRKETWPGNDQRPHFSELQKSIFLHVN